MNIKGKNYRELPVWQKAMQAAEDTYNIVKTLPKEEIFALSDQMRRAAVSIPSNIAEVNARGTNKEPVHFLYIAQGSRAELETQLELCRHRLYHRKGFAVHAGTNTRDREYACWSDKAPNI